MSYGGVMVDFRHDKPKNALNNVNQEDGKNQQLLVGNVDSSDVVDGNQSISNQILELKREIVFLKYKLQTFTPKNLDDGIGKPKDNQVCLVFGDGVKGSRGTYCAAIDRFIMDGAMVGVISSNPRKYFDMHTLENETTTLIPALGI